MHADDANDTLVESRGRVIGRFVVRWWFNFKWIRGIFCLEAVNQWENTEIGLKFEQGTVKYLSGISKEGYWDVDCISHLSFFPTFLIDESLSYLFVVVSLLIRVEKFFSIIHIKGILRVDLTFFFFLIKNFVNFILFIIFCCSFYFYAVFQFLKVWMVDAKDDRVLHFYT